MINLLWVFIYVIIGGCILIIAYGVSGILDLMINGVPIKKVSSPKPQPLKVIDVPMFERVTIIYIQYDDPSYDPDMREDDPPADMHLIEWMGNYA